jgi:hypothetical protein
MGFAKRGKLLDSVNNIKTNYGLGEQELHCLTASAHVLVYGLRPKLRDAFGELREVSERTGRGSRRTSMPASQMRSVGRSRYFARMRGRSAFRWTR